jgi:microcystin-dependent protein
VGFSAVTITNAGLQAINTILSTGGTLAFASADGGSGYPTGTDDPKTFTALKTPVMAAQPTSANNAVLYQSSYKIVFSSANAPFQFQLNEMGLWYSLNGATPFLFGYSTTGAANGDIITPTGPTGAVEKDYVIPVVYSQAVPVTTDVTLTGSTELHATTHLSTGTDPLPIASSTIGGLTPKTNANASQVLVGDTTSVWGPIPIHGWTHCGERPDPMPVSTTSYSGACPQLSGDPETVLTGVGSWGAGRIPGEIVDYAGGTAPAGWLLCDGMAYLQTQYPALFNVIGGGYGWSGAYGGNNTFNVPDCRGRSTLGAGQGPGLTYRGLAGTGGEENHTLSYNEMPWHNHGINDPGHAHGVYDPSHAHGVWDGGHNHTLNDPGHNHDIIDSGHTHGVADPGHGHGVSDPTHSHAVYDPAHSHGVADPAHSHAVSDPAHRHTDVWLEREGDPIGVGEGPNTMQGAFEGRTASAATDNAYTNVAIYNANTGIGINKSGTSIAIYNAGTGLGVNASGTGIGIYAAFASIGTYNRATGCYNSASGANTAIYNAATGLGIYGNYTGISTQNAGASWGHANLHPFITFNKIIKT